LEKIDTAFHYIKDNIKWNGVNSLYVSSKYKNNFLKDHSGNSSEINLALVSLLKRIGINAYPVVLSTRDNGRLQQFSPSLAKLNYVVCYVKFGTVDMLLDATQEKLIPGILPKKCLNGNGWLIDDGNGFWIDLSPKHKYKVKQYTQIKLNKDNYFEAQVNRTHYDYAYLEWAEKINQYADQITYKSSLMDEFPSIDILTHTIKKDNSENLNSSELISVDMSNYVDEIDDEYIINPHPLTKFADNPFKSNTRKFPVDLNYQIEESSIIVLQLPDGYRVKKIPEPVNLKGLDGDLDFTFFCQENGANINIICKIKVNRSIFSEKEYHLIKSFFSTISDKYNDPIVLTKI